MFLYGDLGNYAVSTGVRLQVQNTSLPAGEAPYEAPCVPNNTTKDKVPSLLLDKCFYLNGGEEVTQPR